MYSIGKMKLFVLIFATLLGLALGKPMVVDDDGECAGYDACAAVDANKINVHIIPHSHDDVGWLNTVDQYYYQTVETIISSVVGGLLQNEKRRFVQVETAFFKKWWVEQPELTKQWVRKLVNEGRLEMIGGAWSMNDEAAAHYQSTIDQFTLGFRFFEDNIGKCARPKVAWQIDPFGHSREQASLSSQLGFDSFYFARLDYRDRSKRKNDKTMDLLWTGSANLGSDSNVFTSAFESHYSAPGGFCFDIKCSTNDNKPIVTDKDSAEYNLDERVADFVKIVQDAIIHRPTNNLLLTFGDDFTWEAAERSFNNIDKLIKGFETLKPTINGTEVNVIYSTPSCYAKAVNQMVNDNKQKLDVKTDDFMPYASSPNDVWSGFYTSRAASKRFERMGNNHLQAFRQLSALAKQPDGSNRRLEEAMGVMQHHDAITGTEKDHVKNDYHKLLSRGFKDSVENSGSALSNVIGLESAVNLQICLLANVSICESSNKDEFDVLLYNPLARAASHYIQIPVSGDGWKVTGPDGKDVEIALTEPIRNFDYITKDIGGTLHDKIIIFKADSIPAVGYKIYKITKDSSLKLFTKPRSLELKADTSIGFDDKFVTLDEKTGLVKSITLNGVTLNVKQEMMFYNSSDSSGAYSFRPSSDDRDAHELESSSTNTILTESGNVVREIKQVWKDWATQIIRIYKDEDFIEFDFLAGPIDTSDSQGTELIMRYSTDLKTDGVFYTDSNGREMIYRKRDWRATYDYTNEEPQAGNYYPVNARISINDGNTEFAVLTDRSEGGSSLNDGEVELMVNRALLHDDSKGVGEALNEQEFNQGLVVRGSHFVTLGSKDKGNGKKSLPAIERDIALRKLLQPIVFYPDTSISKKSFSALKQELPDNVHLLTLDVHNDTANTVLIRLEHILEKGEDSNLSKEVTVDLSGVFNTFTIVSLEERLLGANTPLSESSRLKWSQLEETPKDSILSVEKRLERAADDLSITLAPMQIRTFVATVTRP